MNQPLLHFDNVSKRFGRRLALAPLDLQIERGEIFGLLGHNGAGKSTTFGLLLGHIRPDTGRVLLDGVDVLQERAKALARVGAIFETPSFYDYLSARSNLDFFVSLTGPVDPNRFDRVVELVGLTGRLDEPVRNYSHGMRQRLALAQALLPCPSFLILDEPNDGLDPRGIIETRQLLLRLREEEGLTILFSSHILSEVEQLCDRVAILREGQLVFCGQWQETGGTGIRLRIRCRHPERAAPVLAAAGFPAWQNGETIPWPEAQDVAALATALVQADAELLELSTEKFSLEDFYLGHAGAADAAPSIPGKTPAP
jgi:ABC-2 type transport system ATP-binding protein